jgi:hypothetical protein
MTQKASSLLLLTGFCHQANLSVLQSLAISKPIEDLTMKQLGRFFALPA